MKLSVTDKQKLVAILGSSIILGTGIGFFGSRFFGKNVMISIGAGLFAVGASLQLGQVILKKSSQ
ncbi:hypothetical protein F7734_48920 [Scytonema sp. UIC 10036]|uniref:hypothetical protein n=1 Tax=Scytonema sp. UIC 10036 TaxID=2304196 RepID=UPI0012DA924C|nr:hypothetical protein [Scytonema sp. UIC 10036]MUG99781.1 hypothetical protein [Scytonema sp. UIC 10036]